MRRISKCVISRSASYLEVRKSPNRSDLARRLGALDGLVRPRPVRTQHGRRVVRRKQLVCEQRAARLRLAQPRLGRRSLLRPLRALRRQRPLRVRRELLIRLPLDLARLGSSFGTGTIWASTPATATVLSGLAGSGTVLTTTASDVLEAGTGEALGLA